MPMKLLPRAVEQRRRVRARRARSSPSEAEHNTLRLSFVTVAPEADRAQGIAALAAALEDEP